MTIEFSHWLLRVRIPNERFALEAPRCDHVVFLAACEPEDAVQVLLFKRFQSPSSSARISRSPKNAEHTIRFCKPQRTILATGYKHTYVSPVLQFGDGIRVMNLKRADLNTMGSCNRVAGQITVAMVPDDI
jgi:hypothetical protein